MHGRFWEICRGVNVDLGTSAAFRAEWDREAKAQVNQSSPIPVILKTDQAPGDAVAMTAAIYSLHCAYPGRYATAVRSPWPHVFHYNPDVVPVPSIPDADQLHMHYPAIHQSNDRAIHFMQGWCEHLGSALGVPVPLMTNRPHLYFADDSPPVQDYWLICSGGKDDFTNKLWGHKRYQEVVDLLRYAHRDRVRFVQVGRAEDNHPKLRGVKYMVGKTNLRELFDLCRRARGVLCGVSLLMHVAAALDKPAVVIAGGREPVAWNAYPKQQYVHTVGALPCRDLQGHVGQACWRARVQALPDDSPLNQNTCEYPVDGLPKCMRMISPSGVVELVLRYNRSI